MKESHYKTPRQLREATLTGIGYEAASNPSPLLFFVGLLAGFILGALL